MAADFADFETIFAFLCQGTQFAQIIENNAVLRFERRHIGFDFQNFFRQLGVINLVEGTQAFDARAVEDFFEIIFIAVMCARLLAAEQSCHHIRLLFRFVS